MSLAAADLSFPSRPPLLVGESRAIADLRREIAAAARTHAKVLIVGETGVGKEVVARLIHAQSARSTRPFVAVNCSGIPETLLASELFGHMRGSFTGAYRDKIGLVRQADRGTLFLDELGEMSLPMQAALLRFTETGEIQPVGADAPAGRTDVRLVTATNRDLRTQIEAGAFREDLFYRLNVIQIRVPPLRERADDVLLLVRHYLADASRAHGIRHPDLTPDAEQLLVAYHWPGNVRELKNTTERLVLRDTMLLSVADLPREIREVGLGREPVLSIASRTTPLAADDTTPASARESTPFLAPREPILERLWEQLMAGGDFWTVVQRPFRARELTRADLAALIDRGLQHTRGSYRALVRAFNMPESDYKRFHAFLYQQNCNLPVAPYRNTGVRARDTVAPTAGGRWAAR